MKHDWPRIEHEYVTGRMSMEKLADKHKIPHSTFFKYANGHNFLQKRQEYGRKVEEKALARAEARDSRTYGYLASAAGKAARALNKYITDDKTLFTRVVMGKDGLEEYEVEKIDTKALRDMAAALREVAAAAKLLTTDDERTEENQAGVIFMPKREDEES